MKAHDIDGKLLAIGCNIEIAKIDARDLAYEPPFTIGDRFTIVALYTKSQMDKMYKRQNIKVLPDIWCQIDNDWFCRCGAVRLIPDDKKSDNEIVFEVMEKVKQCPT